MDRFDVDRDPLYALYDLYKAGRIDLTPTYQRSRVWTDDLRFQLIDSIQEQFPIGLVMLNVVPHVDEDGTKLDKFDVVDGQQRMRTVFEYMDGTGWAASKGTDGFQAFAKLSAAKQARFKEYKIPVAKMKDFEQEDIEECFNRLQKGRPLKIGEKLKSLTTSKFYPFLQTLAGHQIFSSGGDRHKVRDSHWTLAASFLKSIHSKELFARLEYKNLADFLKAEKVDKPKAAKTLEDCKKILNFENKVLEEAVLADKNFEKFTKTARTLKWLFVAIAKTLKSYSIGGREHLVAAGVLNFYKLISVEGSGEWTTYVNTGRSGRIDTADVKASLADLINQILIFSKAEPLDPKRFFDAAQREQLFKNSNGLCQECSLPITQTNFHADHVKPHSQGGQTTVANGRALCSKCNRAKGNTWKDFLEVSAETKEIKVAKAAAGK